MLIFEEKRTPLHPSNSLSFESSYFIADDEHEY